MPLYLDLSRKTCRRSDLNQRSLASPAEVQSVKSPLAAIE